jgi:hypothetical protein
VSTVIVVFGDNCADKQEGGKNFAQSATRKTCFLVLRLYRSHVSCFEIQVNFVISMCACFTQFLEGHGCFVLILACVKISQPGQH